MKLKFWEKSKQLKQDYRMVFGTDEGKRVLNDLLKQNYVLGTTANGDLQINEGRRIAVLQILQMLEVSPEQYRKLYGESVDDYLENLGEDYNG